MQRLVLFVFVALLAGLLAACRGAGSGGGTIGRFVDFHYEWNSGDVTPDFSFCGMVEIDGRGYRKYCDDSGPVLLVPDDAPDRLIRVRRLQRSGSGHPRSNARRFLHDGAEYEIMAMPETPIHETFEAPAAKLLEQYGVIIGAETWSTDWTIAIDEDRRVADVRFGATEEVPLPDPFEFDCRNELVVVPGPDRTFAYQRIVGRIDEVRAYLEALLGPDGTFTVRALLGA
jgi:hypothetical protein